jgi:hypothetical protein
MRFGKRLVKKDLTVVIKGRSESGTCGMSAVLEQAQLIYGYSDISGIGGGERTFSRGV